MRKYTHWLRINRYVRNEAEQWEKIQNYLEQYPEADATIYTYDSGAYNRVVKLVCYQEYAELGMDVNSFSTNLVRLKSKPLNITEKGAFTVPDYVKRKMEKSL